MVSLWPLISIASGELKPRSVFVAEKALSVPSSFLPAFTTRDVRRARAMSAELAAANATFPADVAAWVVRQLPPPWQVCLQPRTHMGFRGGAPNVVAQLRGPRGALSGATLLASAYPASSRDAVGLGGKSEPLLPVTPHSLFLVLALARVLAAASWRAKDTTLVICLEEDFAILTPSPTSADAVLPMSSVSSPALDDFLAARSFDPAREACYAARAAAWRSGDMSHWLDFLLQGDAACSRAAAAGARISATSAGAASSEHDSIWARPLPPGFSGGGARIWGAVTVVFPPGAPLGSVDVGVHGPGGRLAEIDLVALVTGSLRGLPHTIARPAGGGASGVEAAIRRLLERFASDAVGFLDPAIRAGLSALGLPCPSAGSSEALARCIHPSHALTWASGCAELFAFWLQVLAGSSGPQGALIGRGIDAVSLRGIPARSSDVPGGADWALETLGAALERTIRALHGLDERLHANSRAYVLFSPQLFVGLPEYALALIPFVAVPLVAVGMLGTVPHAAVAGGTASAAWALVAASWSSGLGVAWMMSVVSDDVAKISVPAVPMLLLPFRGIHALWALASVEVAAAFAAVIALLACVGSSTGTRVTTHSSGWPLIFTAWLLFGWAVLALAWTHAALAFLAVAALLPLLLAATALDRERGAACAILRLAVMLITVPAVLDEASAWASSGQYHPVSRWLELVLGGAQTASPPLPLDAAAVFFVAIVPIHGILLTASLLDVASRAVDTKRAHL